MKLKSAACALLVLFCLGLISGCSEGSQSGNSTQSSSVSGTNSESDDFASVNDAVPRSSEMPARADNEQTTTSEQSESVSPSDSDDSARNALPTQEELLAAPIATMTVEAGTKPEFQNQPSQAERKRIQEKVERKREALEKAKESEYAPYSTVPLAE